MINIYPSWLFTLYQISRGSKMRINNETCIQHKVPLKISFYCVNIDLNCSNTHHYAAICNYLSHISVLNFRPLTFSHTR